MKTIINAIILAISAIAGYKAALKAKDEEISRLRGQIDNEAADDAARDEELVRRRALDADLEEADRKANELAQLLNEEPALPTVNTGTFEVTAPPTEGVEGLEFRDRQKETAGQTGTVGFPSGNQTGTAPQSSQEGQQTNSGEAGSGTSGEGTQPQGSDSQPQS